MKNWISRVLVLGVGGLVLASSAQGAETVPAAAVPPQAARSVHLRYPAPEATLYYNEVKVLESQNSSYFSVCGFGHGYFGIQQLAAPDDKVVIFSVWDTGAQNDPGSVSQDHRVTVLYHDPQVEVKRFGGEGTGAQSFYHYHWKIGDSYKFALKAAATGDRTAYSAFFYINETRQWKRLATFATLTQGEGLKALYSFIEDFRRDGQSAKERRSAIFHNGWTLTKDGDWVSLARATFTGDSTPTNNINAAVSGDGFLLATGGNTANVNPLNAQLQRNPTGRPLPE